VGVPSGPINRLDQVFADPQVVFRGMQINPPTKAAKGGKIPGVRTPIMIDGKPMAAKRPSPRLGEHTSEILREIGEVKGAKAPTKRAAAVRRTAAQKSRRKPPARAQRPKRRLPTS
jgi:crotonobetainyl-CoA:carnitine CoA-transferase CaiB-like acyl-CoA transferase